MFRFSINLILVSVVVATTALPPAAARVSDFADVAAAGPHAAAVEALEADGILADTGCAEGAFCPDEPLSRWVMAVWLVRAVDGQPPPDTEFTIFADVEKGAWWAGYVERLAELGITVGCEVDPLMYCPSQSVTRAEMASFLTRAFALEPADSAGFADTAGNPHEEDINALAASGITVGCGVAPARYCPAGTVTRAQMATFLARALKLVPTIEFIEDADGQGVLHLVSQYTTHHPCCHARVTNIHLFADAVDGAVVPPGEAFSLNDHVGQRTRSKGFLGAGTLINGTLVSTVGGGVSQFATTFYNAVFWGGYQDVEHKPHSSYFSRYPEGIEATINWPYLDLVFRNDTSRNVIIKTEYTDTSLTVKFFGDNDGRFVVGEWKDKEGRLEVVTPGGSQARVVTAEVSRRLNWRSPPEPLYRANPRLAVDQRRYRQPALHGWTVRVTRTISQEGQESTEQWGVRYLPLRAIIEVHPCVLAASCSDAEAGSG